MDKYQNGQDQTNNRQEYFWTNPRILKTGKTLEGKNNLYLGNIIREIQFQDNLFMQIPAKMLIPPAKFLQHVFDMKISENKRYVCCATRFPENQTYAL